MPKCLKEHKKAINYYAISSNLNTSQINNLNELKAIKALLPANVIFLGMLKEHKSLFGPNRKHCCV